MIMMPFMFVVEIKLRPGGTGMVWRGLFHLIWTGIHALSLFSAELKNGSHLDELFTLLQMKGHQDSFHLSQSGTSFLGMFFASSILKMKTCVFVCYNKHCIMHIMLWFAPSQSIMLFFLACYNPSKKSSGTARLAMYSKF